MKQEGVWTRGSKSDGRWIWHFTVMKLDSLGEHFVDDENLDRTMGHFPLFISIIPSYKHLILI